MQAPRVVSALALLVLGCSDSASPAGPPSDPDFLDTRQSIRTPEDLLAKRAEFTEFVFGGPLPTRHPDSVEVIADQHYQGLAVERLVVVQEDFASIVYLIHPPQWTGGLALYHQGHSGDFRVHGASTIEALLAAGYQVLAFSMPALGMNEHPFPDRSHEHFADLDYPLAYFIEPVIVALNWADATYEYSIRIMVGLSGGGWTTVWTAALDERIDESYPVAGSWPHYLRERHPSPGSSGDYEQVITPNYLELYLMATFPGRSQLQVFNQDDPCCFEGDFALDYLEYIATLARSFGGDFDMFIDTSHRQHKISSEAMEKILERAAPGML